MQEFEYEKRIMGSEAAISLIAANREIADAAFLRMCSVAETLESTFSRFLPDSELSRINTGGTHSASPLFLDILSMGLQLSERSNKIFNPLVDISRFGYDEDIRKVKGTSRTKHTDTEYSVDSSALSIDAESQTVSLSVGQRLDFGGFLKGHAAECMAREATECGGVILNLGGDIYTQGSSEEGTSFVFSITNPITDGEDALFQVQDMAVATSGTYNRFWALEEKKMHHILDSSGTRNPDSDIVSATVIAPRGYEADGFATVAVSLGSGKAPQFLNTLGFQFYLITNTGDVVMSKHFPLMKSVAVSSYE